MHFFPLVVVLDDAFGEFFGEHGGFEVGAGGGMGGLGVEGIIGQRCESFLPGLISFLFEVGDVVEEIVDLLVGL